MLRVVEHNFPQEGLSFESFQAHLGNSRNVVPYRIVGESFSDRGFDYRGVPTPFPEDLRIISHPMYGVLDGVSAPYAGDPDLYDGLSGGQLIVNKVAEILQNIDKHRPLRSIIRGLSAELKDLLETNFNIDTARPEFNPGAVGALIRFSRDQLEIAAWGDAFAFLQTVDDRVQVLSKNQILLHDEGLIPIFKSLRSIPGIDFWREYMPHRRQAVREHANNRSGDPAAYGLLNGQKTFSDLVVYNTIPISLVKRIFLCTDGFMPEDKYVEPEKIMQILDNEKLAGVLEWSRAMQNMHPEKQHNVAPEATAMSFEIKDQRP